MADELFFTGTASEITPIRSVDRIAVGAGQAGPVTKRLQQRFMQVVRGEVAQRKSWLTYTRRVPRREPELAAR
jgi:branched-chain amino acid aminotransferase